MRGAISVLLLGALLSVVSGGRAGAVEVIVETIPFPEEGDTYPADSALLHMWGVLGDDWGKRGERVSRAEFVRMAVCALGRGHLARILEGLPPEMADAEDIGRDYWGHVNLATALGLISAGEDVCFRPNNPVTAVDALTVIVRGRDAEPEAPYPVGTLSAAEEDGLLQHLEGVLWDAELSREQVHRLLGAVVLQGSGGTVGLLYRLEGGTLELFTEAGEVRLKLAPRVYLAGAEEMEAAVGQVVYVHVDREGRAGYVETGSQVHSHRGTLEDYDLRRGRLRIDDEWVPLELQLQGGVTWECNGMPFVAPDQDFLRGQLEMWISRGAQVAAHLDADNRGRVVVRSWDVPVAAVTGVADGGLSLTYIHRSPWGGLAEETLHFEEGNQPEVCGDVSGLKDLEAGDLIQLSTVGGWGLETHCIEVTRRRITGVVGGHRVRRTREGVSYFVHVDDEEIEVDGALFLGDPDELLNMSIVTLALDRGGCGIYLAEGCRIDEATPVMLMEYGLSSSELQIEVDYRGTRLAFESDVSPAALAAVMDEGTDVMSRMVFLHRDDEGTVVDLSPASEAVVDLDGDGAADGEVVVVSLNAEEPCVTLRVDNPGGEPGYVVIPDPAIYNAGGQFLEVESVSRGDVLLPYSAGEVPLLLRDE